MRLNKFIAEQGICSRRQADEKIKQGLILVNQKTTTVGYILEVGDIVNYKGQNFPYRNQETEPKLIYIALNKPVGIECTCSEAIKNNLISFLYKQKAFKEIIMGPASSMPRLYPIGRLDKNSRGLLILTNDGELTHKLSHPKFEHEKEYLVTVNKSITKEFLLNLSRGVEIIVKKDGSKARTLPCPVKQETSHSFKIILKQGYKRQIRQCCKVLGYEVVDLLRFRIAKLNLYELSLNEGEFKLIDNLYY